MKLSIVGGLMLFLGFGGPTPSRAGDFMITTQRYEHVNLNVTHDRLFVISEARYIGPIDPEDHFYFMENFIRMPAGNLFERTGNGLSGGGILPDMVLHCDRNCSPDVAIPKCSPQGYPTTYRGRTLVGIYHQFDPETESKLMSHGSTVCAHSCPEDGEDHEIPPDDPDDTIP